MIKRQWINHTRQERALRIMNCKMQFILAAFDDDDDDPGIAAAPAPTPPPDGFDGMITDYSPVVLIELAVLA